MGKRILIGSMLVLAMLLLMPSIPAIQKKTIEEGVNDDLPDVIVENIFFYSRQPAWDVWELNIDIKNIGEGIAIETITVNFIILRLLFGILPIIPVRIRTTSLPMVDGILPGETQTRCIATNDGALPQATGSYIVIVTINKDENFNESNYSNNWRLEKHLRILGYWY